MFHVSVRREHLLFASYTLGEVNRSFGHSQKNEKNRSFDRPAYAEETAWADTTRGKKNRGADPARVRAPGARWTRRTPLVGQGTE